MTRDEAFEIARPVFNNGEGLNQGEALYGFTWDDQCIICRIPMNPKIPNRLMQYRGITLIVGPTSEAADVVALDIKRKIVGQLRQMGAGDAASLVEALQV
jgi:hypothetical protein